MRSFSITIIVVFIFLAYYFLVIPNRPQAPASTQAVGKQAPERNWHEYPIKFICGKPGLQVLAPGKYFSAINVHNPDLRKPVKFWFKVAVALPRLKAGPVSKFRKAKLKADQALEIDCPTILKLAKAQGFLKGFVVILSKRPIDIVAVYTAAGVTGQVETLHMERIDTQRIANPSDIIKTQEAPVETGPANPGA